MAEEYDISRAFERIEEELIASMIRNMDRHRAEESAYGYEWSQWQAEQLRSLEHYRAENQSKFGRQFSSLNQRIENAIRAAHETGGMEQEEEILDAIRRGFTGYSHLPDAMIQGNFFRVNQRKLDALIQATTNDMRTAETAILRMANDQYRRVVFDAQVYAASGAGTYEKAVDMATHDMLAAGLNCVQYKNGARHTLSDYADMAIRTACKRAKLQGEGQKRQEWGVSTVIMNKRGNPCPKCLPWVGKVLIDDVWSGGSRKDGPYPLMSTAIAAGLYHPRCKDGHTTYFEGISTPPDSKFTRKELKQIENDNRKEAQKQYAERQKDKFGRLADYSLDPENKKRYIARKNAWEEMSYMSNSFRPEFGEATELGVGAVTIPVKRVKNSRFNLFSDDTNRKSKAVRLTEKMLRKIQEDLPSGFQMPKIAVVDFNKYGINPRAIGGYQSSSGIFYMNSKYNTKEKILDFVNGKEGWFANTTEKAPFLHELGHKYYEDCVKSLANARNISYDEAKKSIDKQIYNFIQENLPKEEGLEDKLSGYALKGYKDLAYTEIIAESVTVKNSNVFAEKLLDAIRDGGE
jgi:hypothetical protein